MRTLFFLLMPLFLTAQSFPMKDGKITYQGVEELPGKSKSEIISSAKVWFAKVFKDSRDVLELVDADAGRLVANASLGDLPGVSTVRGAVFFTITIECKDGKYRYIMSDFNHRWLHKEASVDGGPLEDEKADGGGMTRMQTRVWNNYKKFTFEAMPQVQQSLIESMSKSSIKDDW